MGARQSYTDSEMRFLVRTPLEVEVEADLVKRRKLKAVDARKSAATTTKLITEICSASTQHENNGGGSCGVEEDGGIRQTPT